MICPKCNRTMFKQFQNDFIICINCSTLVVLTPSEPIPKSLNGITNNSRERTIEINAKLDAIWNDIVPLRQAGVGYRTIIATLGLDWSLSVTQKRILAREKELGLISPGKKLAITNYAAHAGTGTGAMRMLIRPGGLDEYPNHSTASIR